jgi:REP-associated tyrosine transposase
MSIPPRRAEPEEIASNARTFFVTSSTYDRRNLFQSDRAVGLFLKVLYEYRAQGKFRLHEFVVMPDHFHLLLTVGSEISVEKAVQFIKGGFAFRAGKELSMKAPIWQKGFSEVRILDAAAYAQVREYIRNNPVKGRLVVIAEQYPHSSAHSELDSPPQGLKPDELSSLVDTAEAVS